MIIKRIYRKGCKGTQRNTKGKKSYGEAKVSTLKGFDFPLRTFAPFAVSAFVCGFDL